MISPDTHLAGLPLPQLRQRYQHELFESVLPFWHQYGIDHQYGGVLHALDYDGSPVNHTKLSWFQGRALWVYSFLYNNFGRNPAWLDIARQTRAFLLQHAPQPDGWWAEAFHRDGSVLRPFSGDLYGMYFAAEGLQEYAWAANDDESRHLAFALMRQLHVRIEDPSFACMDCPLPGQRSQGLWMVNLNIARQMVARWPDPEIQAILDQAIDAVIHHHYNPDIGLNNEVLNHDFSRHSDHATRCQAGHSVETLWMIAEEARRRNDQALWDTCTARIRRHLDVGWDHVYGGFSECVNVNQGGYQWPPYTPVGTTIPFRFTGEYFYMKPLWALNEILIATLNILEHRPNAHWAADYFTKAQAIMDEKYSRKRYGQPGYLLFTDRLMTQPEHTARQDNYHPPRQLMLSILTLDRLLRAV
ncbi:MAG: AGE family epimerase/isomerase [Bryobacterales bacterium]|nr:AGE family epimerase/isomerase [Bryobacterales bacterium]